MQSRTQDLIGIGFRSFLDALEAFSDVDLAMLLGVPELVRGFS